MRTAHLFAGAGGGLLADIILGHNPVLAVEQEESCCNSLRDRAEEGWFPCLHVHCGDVREFDFTPWRDRVDCLSAGFPCQDISCAGKGAGIAEGARSGLVTEVYRAIDDIRPPLVFLENSPQIRTRGRHLVIAELVARGYSWRDGFLSAADVGGPHLRDRWWLLAANADGMRQLEQEGVHREQWGWNCYGAEYAPDPNDQRWNGRPGCKPEADGRDEPTHCDHSAPNLMRQRLQIAVQRGGLREAEIDAIHAAAGYTGAYHWSPPDCGICGVVDGVAVEMDGNTKSERIKAAGNGQVPLAAAAAWMILAR